MEETQNLVKTSMEEIRGVLSAERVVGEPIVVGGNTIIPLVNVGFGFGVGAGAGKGGSEKETGEGTGGATGGGGGVKPVALIIVNEGGVRVEPMKGAVSSLAESVSDLVVKVMEKRAAVNGQGKEGEVEEEEGN